MGSTVSSLGILHRQSCAYTHEQNGRVEHHHRYIVETGLALLTQGFVPLKYWVYAVETSVFFINRLPSSAIGMDSPYCKLFLSEPDYSYLWVFGCLCFSYLRPYNKHKFAYRSSPCVFLGYPVSFRGYRCMDLNTGKIFIWRHVRFDESVFPFAKTSFVRDCSFIQSVAPVVPMSDPMRHMRHMTLRHMPHDSPLQALMVSGGDPTCYSQAVIHLEWRSTMDD